MAGNTTIQKVDEKDIKVGDHVWVKTPPHQIEKGDVVWNERVKLAGIVDAVGSKHVDVCLPDKMAVWTNDSSLFELYSSVVEKIVKEYNRVTVFVIANSKAPDHPHRVFAYELLTRPVQKYAIGTRIVADGKSGSIVVNEPHYVVEFDNLERKSYSAASLESAKDVKPNKFAVGDLVEYVGRMTSGLVGKQGRVTDLGSDFGPGGVDVCIDDEIVHGILPENLAMVHRSDAKDFAKVPDVKIGSTVYVRDHADSAFEKDDRVEYIGTTTDKFIGKRGVVLRIVSSSNVVVKFDGNTGGDDVSPDNIVKLVKAKVVGRGKTTYTLESDETTLTIDRLDILYDTVEEAVACASDPTDPADDLPADLPPLETVYIPEPLELVQMTGFVRKDGNKRIVQFNPDMPCTRLAPALKVGDYIKARGRVERISGGSTFFVNGYTISDILPATKDDFDKQEADAKMAKERADFEKLKSSITKDQFIELVKTFDISAHDLAMLAVDKQRVGKSV